MFQTPPPPPRYLVVIESKLEHSDYEQASRLLALARKGEVVRWDGDWDHLETLLLARKPTELALVLDPGTIDANLPRRLIPILTRFDDDPFVDCSFGLITGATGADALALVQHDLALAGHELPARKLEATSVVVDKCVRLAERDERGPEGRELATTSLWVTGKDAGWKEFLAQSRGEQHGCGLLEWGHCGDPQGIWLFSMYRNREKDKHWAWDPKKVGQDPAGELPRMTPATLLDGVDLAGAVVINGSCHSAVTRRAIVGPDIVSTFGDTGGLVHFFDIAPADSFPLQAIAHGASAYLGPLAANNANRAAIEEWWVRSGGISLGEATRRCYDELVMGASKLPLSFALYEAGKPEPEESPMFQSCFHRVLFGDPALVPWKDKAKNDHDVGVDVIEGGLRLRIRWNAIGSDPFVWDPWREARGGDLGRLYERIELTKEQAAIASVHVLDAWTRSGKTRTDLALEPRWLVERDPWGKYVLHLVLRGPRARMSPLERKDMPESIGADVEVSFSVFR